MFDFFREGKITLFTKIFGRGTDFKIHDEIVTANGGKKILLDFNTKSRVRDIQSNFLVYNS